MDWIILEKFRLFEDVKGYLVSEGGPDPKKEGKKLKNVAVFMKQKGAEVCARYLNKTYFYGKRTEASVYFPDSGEFDGLVPDEASKSALEIVIPKNPSEMEPWCEHVKDLGAHVNRGKGGEIARDGYDGFGSFGGNNNNSNFGMMNQNAAYQQQIMSMQMQIQQMQQNMMNNPMTQIPSSIKQDPTFGAIPALPPNATYSQLASIQKILEKVHGYEEYLINNYHDNATTLPEQIPPASYMVLLKRRAQCKAMMAKLEQQGQNKNKGPGSMAAINNAWANNTATWGPKRKKNNWQN